ncbi:MAG TPA: hypothetical protein VK447_02070 [Myxococcaceae bacterium]|nr:hypothetical protein [Myxococcaceae bacterium]
MKRNTQWGVLLAGLTLFAAGGAWAGDEADVTSLYEVRTEGSSSKVKAGEKGTFVLAIKTKGGAHISEEAPLKIEVSGDKVKPEKAKLSRTDSVGKKEAGQTYADPRFEVPFVAEANGKGAVNAKLTFFVCTDKICSRQQKAVSVPVEVQ